MHLKLRPGLNKLDAMEREKSSDYSASSRTSFGLKEKSSLRKGTRETAVMVHLGERWDSAQLLECS